MGSKTDAATQSYEVKDFGVPRSKTIFKAAGTGFQVVMHSRIINK